LEADKKKITNDFVEKLKSKEQEMKAKLDKRLKDQKE